MGQLFFVEILFEGGKEMKIGVSSKILWNTNTYHAIDKVWETGFTAVEIWVEQLWRDSKNL